MNAGSPPKNVFVHAAVPVTDLVIQRESAPYFTNVGAGTVNEEPSLASQVPAAGAVGGWKECLRRCMPSVSAKYGSASMWLDADLFPAAAPAGEFRL